MGSGGVDRHGLQAMRSTHLQRHRLKVLELNGRTEKVHMVNCEDFHIPWNKNLGLLGLVQVLALKELVVGNQLLGSFRGRLRSLCDHPDSAEVDRS